MNENWYKRGLGIAYDAKLKPETLKWSEDYVRAYPTPTSWRTALQIYRQDNPLDDNQTLDPLLASPAPPRRLTASATSSNMRARRSIAACRARRSRP